jgi:hypothetical protein
LWMARAMHFVTNHVRWGEHRGGMFVAVQGQGREGNRIVREWHLLAEGDDGPLIPCMAVEAVIVKALAGHPPSAGARTAISDVDLTSYDALFARRTIYTGIRQRTPVPDLPLYQRVLGEAWDRLPLAIRQLHSVVSASSFAGHCTVRRGLNPLAWTIATLIGFPKTGVDQKISVKLTVEGDKERWLRASSGRKFSSVQELGRGRSEWLVRERFGPVAVDMALVVDGACLRYVIRRWNLFGIPFPLWLGPRSTAFESVEDGNFKFDVEVSHPFTGLIVRYRGLLMPIAGHAE